MLLSPKKFLLNSCISFDAAAVNPEGSKTLLASGVSTFFIEVKPVFIKGQRNLPKNCPKSTILDNWVFENFMLAVEAFAKTFRIFEICELVENNSCGKLASSL